VHKDVNVNVLPPTPTTLNGFGSGGFFLLLLFFFSSLYLLYLFILSLYFIFCTIPMK